jgi:hypothetical protein
MKVSATANCILTFFLLILFLQNLSAKKSRMMPEQQHSIELSNYGGFVYKHTENMRINPKGYTFSWQADYFYQTSGRKFWHSKLNYPAYGIGFFQQYNPVRDSLGVTSAIVPTIRLVWLRRKKLEGYFGLGTGLAWVSKIYNPTENPQNNIIGSHVNLLVQLKPGIRYFFTPHLAAGISGSINHVSNGSMKKPNLGINTFGGSVTLSYHFRQSKSVENHLVPELHKNGYWFRMGFGLKEKETNFITKKRPVYNLYGGYSRMTGHTNKLMAGLQLTYDQTDYDELFYDYPGQQSFSRIKASNVSILIGDELMVGHLGIMALMGIYVYYPENKPSWMFWRIGGNLYSRPLGNKGNTRCFVGVSLKANGTTADHLELAAGMIF